MQRIFCLEPGFLIGNQSICDRMRFIEAVAAELLNQGKERFGFLLGVSFLLCPADKFLLQRSQFGFFLLGHRLAQHVCPCQREAGIDFCRQHRLFLIDHDAIRLFQNRLEFQSRIMDILRNPPVLDIHRNAVLGSRAEQCQRSGDVFKAHRPDLSQQCFHTFRFDLENPERIRIAEYLISPVIIQRNLIQAERRIFFPDLLHDLLNRREIPVSEKVHLDQAAGFQIVLVILARLHIAVDFHRRNHFIQRQRRHDDAGRMDARMARQSLQLCSNAKQVLVFFFGLYDFPQAVIFGQRLLQRDAGTIGNQAADEIDIPLIHGKHFADIPDHLLRPEGSERHDVGNMVIPVFLPDIINDILSPVILDIRVDIRHGYPVRIQESFKQQIPADRINHRDAEAVRN